MAWSSLLAGPLRSRPVLLKVGLLLFLLSFLSISIRVTGTHTRIWSSFTKTSRPKPYTPKPLSDASHPIDNLIYDAHMQFDDLLARETHTYEDTVRRYEQLRGRNPPPQFQRWYEFARKRKAVVVEEFFDQIYHDLSPYRGRPAVELRREAASLDALIQVRNGTASRTVAEIRTPEWLDMISSIAEYLPDMDIPLNTMDEPRLMVPWEDIEAFVATEQRERKILPADQTPKSFGRVLADRSEPLVDITWESSELTPFERARRGCPPGSLSRETPILHDFSHPNLSTRYAQPQLYQGYVRNTTLAADLCHQPDLQSNQGIFISPVSFITSPHLYPLFGECKLSTNNEILIPSAVYWTKNEQYSGGEDHGVPWDQKMDAVIWRGANAGGRNDEHNWVSFQRPRFVAMVNGTKVKNVENGEEQAVNFQLPGAEYNLQAARERHLGEWLEEFVDVAFVTFECWPILEDLSCAYLEPVMEEKPGVSMKEMYRRKYLPDIDGNSFSGRYRAFLLSTSLPIKSTIWREWLDSRLKAWVHFAPMSHTYQDWYGLMDYFLSRDEEAERIAMAGKAWAERVLRREDMQVYMIRLLYEWAAIVGGDR